MLARVYGPAPFKQDVHQALGQAGVETAALGDLSGMGLSLPPEPGTVDVVCTADPTDARFALVKRADRRRPVLGVVPSARTARAALGAWWGPDACVLWPAQAEALAAGVVRACALAPRPAFFRWPRLLVGLTFLWLAVALLAATLGRWVEPRWLLGELLSWLALAVTFFVRIRSSASPGLMLAGGLFFLLTATFRFLGLWMVAAG